MNLFSLVRRDPDASKKLFETILDTPNGKRALSRLARTCRAVAEPALNVLWRELDSLVPIIGLFPNPILKKARRPGLGLSKTPVEADWRNILKYSEKVRRISYDEASNNIAASIFPILDECRPRTHILPRLHELTWKAETPAGLDRCALFLSPEIRVLNLEIGSKFPQLSHFLSDMSARTKLTSFSFVSPTPLPDNFTDLLAQQDLLENINLVAPGALSPGVGRWVASLPKLKSLQLDLSGRSIIAVEGFFDELRPRSGDSTPSDVDSESGVFSDDELDFSEIRKSALRLTGDLPSKGSFAQLRKLQLTGDVSNIAVFLRHIMSPLSQLDLVIEDPPDNADWQDLCAIMCERFSESLQSLRVSATGSSRFADLVRSTARAEPAGGRLSLEHLTSLPFLTRLEIDLPESTVFLDADIENLSKACPNLESLRLCPLARFSQNNQPKLSLDSLAHLVVNCGHLHTIAIVLSAKQGNAEVLASRAHSSRSLLRLSLGHSWISDPLQASIFLSHIAPYLETLKWFQEKNRPGFVETNAKGWQSVAETLPHLQNIRIAERKAASRMDTIRPRMANKGIDATVRTLSRGVLATPKMYNASIQFSPTLIDQFVEAIPSVVSAAIDATPSVRNACIEALALTVEQGVEAKPHMVSMSIDATPATTSQAVETSPPPPPLTAAPTSGKREFSRRNPALLFLLSILKIISYPLTIPSRILRLILSKKPKPDGSKRIPTNDTNEKTETIVMDTLQVRQ
ncbi:hypothetical protein BDN72DRAFT_37304 [Pluteus cervinus]|uniref:Uncharacterized protein n=1 Tax=Pluteus cervinus TaxID=181527 RepID=A0ACD3BJC2_9AGAR|nr:hypothetical protein BDN72DRAFT_37304 [Pluteus cervinus]